jgi:hypothetical protein
MASKGPPRNLKAPQQRSSTISPKSEVNLKGLKNESHRARKEPSKNPNEPQRTLNNP